MALIAYIGNFRPEHSTENDVRRTLIDMGHRVVTVQEQEMRSWDALLGVLEGEQGVDIPDLVLWTSTYQYAQDVGPEIQREMQWRARRVGVPTMGFHLDRWWGLQRWKRVLTQPFFRCDYVLTADGGHQGEFGAADVNHFWSPPAIAPHNAVLGTPRPEFETDILFVGSWLGGYHEEWTHRPQLIKHLRRHWGKRLLLLPVQNGPGVRGQDLADAYASAKVVVGDSCLVPKVDGSPMTSYHSDRVPETVGRGGLLIHPEVPGALDGTHYTHGEHLLTWPLYDWSQLDEHITWCLDSDADLDAIRDAGFAHVKARHTYAQRLDWALGLVGL